MNFEQQQKNKYEELYVLLEEKEKFGKVDLVQKFKLCAQFGIFRHAISAEYGGHDDTFLNLCEAYENLGSSTGDNGLVLALNAHVWGVIFPMVSFGTKEQQKKYLDGLMIGTYVGAQAMTEPDAGSDVAAMKTYAKKVEGGYIINGHKKYITNAPIANLVVVYARSGDDFSAYLVNTEDKGVKVSSLDMDGFYSSAIGEVVLEDCFVTDECMLGKPGAGMSILKKTLELERAFIFAGIIGYMKNNFATIISRMNERKSHNKSLIKNQIIRHKIAELALSLETMRLWVYKCAKMKDDGERIHLASSYVKLCASELYLKYTLELTQMFGAAGLEKCFGVSQAVLDALAGRLMSGSSEIQKDIISALIGSGKKFLLI